MRRIPSLDGLRAVSIALVLVAHSVPNNSPHPFLWKVMGNGDLGVSIFFVISGFLITSLLVKEHSEAGQISLKSFYIRRAFRILPPFYAFLFVLFVLGWAGILKLSLHGWVDALMFLRDYLMAGDWWTAHTWSLSIEEQFYLLWPLCLGLIRLRNSRKVALGLLLATPIIRVMCHLLFPKVGWQEQLMFHMRIDGLMTGCALALFHKKMSLKWTLVAPVALFLFVVSPYLIGRFAGYYLLPFGFTLDNLAIAYLLLYVVRNPLSMAGRFLNNRMVVHIGVISYSLYLWQQLFVGKWPSFLGILGASLAAELSWRVIERPSLRLRDRAMEPRKLAVAA